MRFHVESWAPEYGSPAEDHLDDTTTDVDVTPEVSADAWEPRPPAGDARVPDEVLFVDGVRRIDARVWIGEGSDLRQGMCASYAAGVVTCNGRATIDCVHVARGVFCTGPGVEAIATNLRGVTYVPRPAAGERPEDLWNALQQQMAELEARAAIDAGAGSRAGAIVVVDGPLGDRRHVPGAVGYVKTHHRRYLGPGHDEVVGALRAGERTPVFLIGGKYPKWSWYLRLPHGAVGHPMSAVVRCEASIGLDLDAVVALADTTALVLPRFASEPHKDPRAPQNLHPIAGLERALRHRLGDPQLLERALRIAASQVPTAAS